jgi:hypothetical protein
MLAQHSACTPFRNAECSFDSFYTGTAEFGTEESFICRFSQNALIQRQVRHGPTETSVLGLEL